MRSYNIGIMCGIAALLLAGCGTIAETAEQTPMVGVISDSPVPMTISADDVRKAKTEGTTILTLPNEKLSLAEIHGFRDDGHVDDVVISGRERGINSGTVDEDPGIWSATQNSPLCPDLIDRYSGDPTCYGVTKLGSRILLNGRRRTFLYNHVVN
jgi:hypothetical protein